MGFFSSLFGGSSSSSSSSQGGDSCKTYKTTGSTIKKCKSGSKSFTDRKSTSKGSRERTYKYK